VHEIVIIRNADLERPAGHSALPRWVRGSRGHMRSGAERQSAHLQITVFDLQDRTRIRDVVAMAIVVIMQEHGFEVGPKLKRA
jgi:hypothetical protein